MSFRVVAKVLRYSEEKLARRLILIVLGEAAHDDGVVWIDQISIARKALLSRTHVAEMLRELDRDGAIETRKAQRGRRRIAVYRVLLPGLDEVDYDRLPFDLDEPFTVSEVPTRSAGDDVGISASTTSESPLKEDALHVREPSLEPSGLVVAAWKENAPPLIEHRDSYLATAKTLTAIRAALRVYPADAVAEAVRNYATVLGGSEYRWSYRWTLAEFLRRGLDRFVPEADPLRNFRSSNGRAGQVTGADFSHLDDL